MNAPARNEIDWQLAIAWEQWERLPLVETKIDAWGLIEQIVFIEEWLLEEERLRRLERWAHEGHLTSEQMARYRELSDLAQQHAPIIERLRKS